MKENRRNSVLVDAPDREVFGPVFANGGPKESLYHIAVRIGIDHPVCLVSIVSAQGLHGPQGYLSRYHHMLRAERASISPSSRRQVCVASLQVIYHHKITIMS